MAGESTGRVALFSVHPKYAQAILRGEKLVEFRRQGLPDDVTHVVLYATAPTQRVVGEFEIEGVERLRPVQAWRKYRRVGGIERGAFVAYYAGAEAAFVIRVRSATAFAEAFPLSDLAETLRPPQSYMYLDPELVIRARRLGQGSRLPVPLVRRLRSYVEPWVLGAAGR